MLLPFEHEHTAQAGLHQEPVCSWAFLPSSAQQQQLYRGSFEPLHNIFDPNALGECQKCLFGGGSGGAALLLGLCWEQQLEEGGRAARNTPPQPAPMVCINGSCVLHFSPLPAPCRIWEAREGI